MVDQRTREARMARENETRNSETRTEAWVSPNMLPDPEPMEGVVYRWIRTSTLGTADPTNVSTRFREGWIPVPKEEVAYMGLMQDHKTRFPENLEVGGLLLCRMDAERAKARQRHFEKVSRDQVAASDHGFLKQSDPRMPVLPSTKTSTTTFGSGRPGK